MSAPAPQTKPENLLLNLACNLAFPTAILSYASGDRALGPTWAMMVALAFPLGYGLYDFSQRRRFNFLSALGFASVLLNGSFTLLKLDGFWFAVKDGVMPALIGVAVLASMKAKEPLVQEFLYNPQIVDVERVAAELAARGNQAGFDRLMRTSSYIIASAMLISAALNYGFARAIIKSPPGTEEINAEIAKMHWISMLGLSVPTFGMLAYALWRLFKGIHELTGLTLDEILRQPPEKKKAAPPEDGDAT